MCNFQSAITTPFQLLTRINISRLKLEQKLVLTVNVLEERFPSKIFGSHKVDVFD